MLVIKIFYDFVERSFVVAVKAGTSIHRQNSPHRTLSLS